MACAILLAGIVAAGWGAVSVAEPVEDWRNLARVSAGEGSDGSFVTTRVSGGRGTRYFGTFTEQDGDAVMNVEYVGGAAPDGERVPAVRLDGADSKVYSARGASRTAVLGVVLDILVRTPLIALAGLGLWVGVSALRTRRRDRSART